MDKLAQEKLESLQKYVPFIDFLLEIDKQKYIKFINIRKWIVLKKHKYPLSDLNKIEQSIITQYKNLIVEKDVKIPQHITDIFAPMNFNQFVNLCSDEEEDEIEVKKNKQIEVNTTRKSKMTKEKHERNTKSFSKIKVVDSDDDLEIVSIDYGKKSENRRVETERTHKTNTTLSRVEVKQNDDFDEISKNILSKIDKLAEDDIKRKSFVYEPNNYTYQEETCTDLTEDNCSSNEETIYQRRTTSDELFKRRTDFQDEIKVPKLEHKTTKETNGFKNRAVESADLKDDEVEVQNLESNKEPMLFTKTPTEIISLESSSESEDERPSTSKAAALKYGPNNNTDNLVEKLDNILEGKDKTRAEQISNSINSNNKVEQLCESIDSVLVDMSDIMDELEDTKKSNNESTTNSSSLIESLEGNSNKENAIKTIPNKDQITKLLEDVSAKIDFDFDTFYAALSCVKQMKITSEKGEVVGTNSPLETPVDETPPPAPPPIINNLSTPASPSLQQQQAFPVYPTGHPPNICYPPPQQQQQLTPPLMPHYAQNANYVPMPNLAPPPRPKININDPRIIKQLQALQNSPLFAYNVLNSETAESIMKVCQSKQWQPPQKQNSNYQSSSACSRNMVNNTGSSNSITYGEYKRRQQEKILEEEKRREEERKAKAEKLLELEKQKLLKKSEDEIRSILLSTLKPCKEQLTTMWCQQKNLNSNSIGNNNSVMGKKGMQTDNGNENVQKTTTPANGENSSSNVNNGEEKRKLCKKSKQEIKCNKFDQKLERIYNELKCTVRGFDQLNDYIPTVDGKSGEKTNSLDADTHSSQTTFTPRPIGLRRRSSIHALSAISEQLGQHSSDCSDSELSQKKNDSTQSTIESKRRLTESYSNLSHDSTQSSPNRRKTIDDIIKPTKRSKTLRIVDDDSTTSSLDSFSSGDEATPKHSKESLISKQPIIKLKRLSEEFIREHTKRQKLETDQNSRLRKNCEKIQNLVEPAKKLTKLKRYNNDCQMTERNTLFCVLCKSKPSDLTNHYIGRHKTESYVSRLDWSELDDLQINTPFAKLQCKSKNCRFDRYEVECPFCKEKLLEPFMNLYHHYSAHTGEYAFQCSHCHLTKPYRPDIQSHILHSKTCRNATIQIMYRYPPDAQCIYLHFCTICNFVQLNEANVLKHLREHHNPSKAVPANVQKCILAAMSDGPDGNETNKPPSPITTPAPVQQEATNVNRVERIQEKNHTNKTNREKTNIARKVEETMTAVSTSTTSGLNFKIDDDDIPVSNEPCLEDEFLEESKFCIEDQLKQLHEGPASNITPQMPVTIIHCMGEPLKQMPYTAPTPNMQPVQATLTDRHLPMVIKTENMDAEESHLMTTSQRTLNVKANDSKPQSIIYEKYRSYPANVNYLGLYKCMIDDCYYSTDCFEELDKHLCDHISEDLKPLESLQCPYCVLPIEMRMTPMQLVEHIRDQHQHLIYQCSMCCYRSCDASNVNIHQQLNHYNTLNACKVYKCSSNDFQVNKQIELDLFEKLVKNVFKISCSGCNVEFYHTQLLINHLNNVHKVHDADDLKIYSCIYCPLALENKTQIRIHIATKHPDELPRIYDHNAPCNNEHEDVINSSSIVDLAESVSCEEIKSAANNEIEENIAQDVKPDARDLMHINNEIVRVRLRKVTEHTGVAPDNLYRCPEPTCGGFFSIFDLWLKHMKVRHYTLECQCPHCPSPKLLTLDKYAAHFEEHRRHTFICFHCPATYPNETKANEHVAKEHADLGQIRFQQIHFNLIYSYYIMIKENLFKEPEHFISEFLIILDNRLKNLESYEIQKLKHQWPVQENALWMDDYLQLINNRRLIQTCLMKDCKFRTSSEDILFKHMRTTHDINGNTYNCSKCNFSVKDCTSFEEIFDHIKLHRDFITICAACSLSTSSRSKMSAHIGKQHSARDVPVIQLCKTNHQLYVKMYVVFADNHLTFSTMKNCFCCPEKNMEGDVLNLHLKRYHKFSLNYYCEKCPSFLFKSLKEVKAHFQQQHSSDKFKIRCELASPNDLSVTSLNDFQVQISCGVQTPQMSTSLRIKEEPIDLFNADDDDVILLEDNDIVIHDALRDELQQPKELPKLKCAALSKLIGAPSNISMPPSSLFIQPKFP